MTDEHTSPFVISLPASPQSPTKDEVILLEDIERNTPISTEPLADADKRNTDDADVKQNFSAVGDTRCATCHESVPRNLMLIRDHVKLHFKEKTGCMPIDLTNLLPNLQQTYCQLLLTSFPSVGASILNDDLLCCYRQPTNQKEPASCHDQISFVEKGSKSIDVTDVIQIENTHHHNPTPKISQISCVICDKQFSSLNSMHCHRAQAHAIKVQWYCNHCKCDLNTSGYGGFRTHLLRKHMNIHHIYECSLCGSEVTTNTINEHDGVFHDGQRKAVVIYNLHRYKVQLEFLRKMLIIDLNSSSNSKKTMASSWKSKKSKKLALRHIVSLNRKVKMNPILSCNICNEKVGSISGMKSHRSQIHGIRVKWYCKECNVNLIAGYVNIHLLAVHIGTKEATKKHEKHLQVLRENLIIDLNSSSSEKQSTTSWKPKNLMSAEGSNSSRFLPTTNTFSCEICKKTFSTNGGMRTHRFGTHGISVNWYCKGCNINLDGHVNKHILDVHLGQFAYECSLCIRKVKPGTIDSHDRLYHDGLGNARVVNNMHRNREQVEEFRKNLIIDLNSISGIEPKIQK